MKTAGKNKKSPQPTGNWLRGNWKHSENSRIYSVSSQKNCPLPCQIPDSGRKSGHQVGKTALKWLDNTVKPCPKIGWRNCQFSTIQQRKKPVTSFLSQAYVWVLQKRYPAIFLFIEVLVPYFNLCKYFFYKSRARNRHSSNDVSLLFLNTIINFHEFFYHK